MIDVYEIALASSNKPPVRDAFVMVEEWIAIFRRRKKVFLIALGSLFALLLLITLTTSKSYTSQASVIVGMARQPNSGDAPDEPADPQRARRRLRHSVQRDVRRTDDRGARGRAKSSSS